MRPFSQLARGEKIIEALRWLAVLPAAMAARRVAEFFFYASFRLARFSGFGLSGQIVAYVLQASLRLATVTLFVIVGAAVAPRLRAVTAAALGVVAIFRALLVHVLVQHLAGHRVGFRNYEHLALETAGAVAAVALVVFDERRRRRIEATSARTIVV